MQINIFENFLCVNFGLHLVLWNLGLYCEWKVCYVCLHSNLNHVIYVMIQVLRSFRGITRLCNILC